jgi:hypothetical protein
LQEAHIPFLIGGAYALNHYAGTTCQTKDLDLFVSPHDRHRTLAVLHDAPIRPAISVKAGGLFQSLFVDIEHEGPESGRLL